MRVVCIAAEGLAACIWTGVQVADRVQRDDTAAAPAGGTDTGVEGEAGDIVAGGLHGSTEADLVGDTGAEEVGDIGVEREVGDTGVELADIEAEGELADIVAEGELADIAAEGELGDNVAGAGTAVEPAAGALEDDNWDLRGEEPGQMRQLGLSELLQECSTGSSGEVEGP